MKITNNHNLPQEVVVALQNDPYDAGKSDISVTTLINPPKIRLLTKAHDHEIETDAMALMYSLWGQSAHAILERVDTHGLKEKRFFWTHPELGWILSGQVDLLVDRILYDYKITSVYKIKRGVAWDWEQQLNINAFLARVNGETIDAVKIMAFMRDWSKSQSYRDWTYPKCPAEIFDGFLWNQEKQYDFITERMILHKTAQDTNELPDCTDQERWMQPLVFKCMKGKNKRSSKNFDNREDAEEWVSKQSDSKLYSVVQSPKVYNRCEHYCQVNKWCHQYLDSQDSNGVKPAHKPKQQSLITPGSEFKEL